MPGWSLLTRPPLVPPAPVAGGEGDADPEHRNPVGGTERCHDI